MYFNAQSTVTKSLVFTVKPLLLYIPKPNFSDILKILIYVKKIGSLGIKNAFQCSKLCYSDGD